MSKFESIPSYLTSFNNLVLRYSLGNTDETGSSFKRTQPNQGIYPDNGINYGFSTENYTSTVDQQVVTIPNFAHWSSRISLLTKGRMPLSDSHPNSWYESENLHLCTLKDFEDLCNTLNIKILDRILISSLNRNSAYLNLLPNLLSYYAMYKLSD